MKSLSGAFTVQVLVSSVARTLKTSEEESGRLFV